MQHVLGVSLRTPFNRHLFLKTDIHVEYMNCQLYLAFKVLVVLQLIPCSLCLHKISIPVKLMDAFVNLPETIFGNIKKAT